MAKRSGDVNRVAGGAFFVTAVSVGPVMADDGSGPALPASLMLNLEGESLSGQHFDISIAILRSLAQDLSLRLTELSVG